MIIISANKKRLQLYFLTLISAFVLPFVLKNLRADQKTSKCCAQKKCCLAIIIDDFGNGSPDTKNFLELEPNFTAAVMPALENTVNDATALHNAGKEIILHMPMEAHTGKKSWLGPNAITSDLDTETIKTNLTNSITQLKYAVGINNHMGSKIMENETIMDLIFQIAREKNLTFIDSKTTPKSKAKLLANKYNVKLYERDVFIDDKNIYNVRQNLTKAIDIAQKKGFAVAIGHVGPAGGPTTALAIKQIYEQYKDKVNFVTISQLGGLGF